MKIRLRILFIAFLILALPTAASAQEFFSGPDTALTRAHQAYLNGDFKTMALNLKQVLEQNPTDSVVKENALSLLEKSYEIPGASEFSVDWRLPDEFKYLRVRSKRMVKDDVGFRFSIFGATVHPNTVSQIQVIRFPDQVILDKQAGIGEWDGGQNILQHSDNQFNFETKKTREPVSSGLYYINLGLTDGTQTKGWFIITDEINATTSPNIYTPSVDQVFNTGTPTFNWQNYFSTKYKSFERRSVWVGVFRSEAPNYDWIDTWGFFDNHSAIEQLTIGSPGADEGSVSKLDPGHYIFFIDYHEIRKFGDLQIARDSIAYRNFKVTN